MLVQSRVACEFELDIMFFGLFFFHFSINAVKINVIIYNYILVNYDLELLATL